MASSFDLQQYIEAYSGEGYIERLIFIASRSESLAPQALRLAIEAVKRTPNTGRYVELVAKLASLSPEDGILDTAWVEEKDRTEALALAALELELNQHLTAQNKEGSRVTLTRIGDHYFRRGDYDNALRNYLRPRTDCVTSDQILELYTNVVKASMALRRLTHVTSYVSKAECVKSQDNDQCQSLLSTFAGIALLDRGSFEQAALRFLSIKHANTEIVSAQDIATYGALCALATFTRPELKSQVLDSPHFKQFLELAPTVQMIVSDFYKSKYSSCFRGLEQLLGELDLDLYIHAQAKALLSAIRHKAILQYFSPFASVSLTSMARAFNTDVASIEKEVASIIAAGQLAGKIDSHSKILYASQTRRRQQTFQNALELASEYETNANALLLRVNLLKSDFVVKPPRKKGDMMGAGLFPTLATLLQFQQWAATRVKRTYQC